MKKIIITFFILLWVCISNWVDAVSVPALGSWTTSQYAWKVVFPVSTSSYSWVYVNTDAYVLSSGANMTISGNFWMSELSSTSDPTLWWAYFSPDFLKDSSNNDIPNSKVVLQNNSNNTFTFSWYVWSKAAWWIYFSPTLLRNSSNIEIPNSSVIYNRWAWNITGCAWSQNIWWVCFDWITLDTTPPQIVWTTVMQADSNQLITLDEIAQKVEIQNWTGGTAITTYYNKLSFNHDMRNAENPSKDYSIKATDIWWNYATWSITIVANIPQINNVNFTWSLIEEKIADWKDKHTIDIKLRDTYGNPVVSVPSIFDPSIRKVEVTLRFSNNLDIDQIDDILNLWDAIRFIGTDIPSLIHWIWPTIDTWSTTDWDYKVEFTSLAPSKFWYNFTSDNNDIQVSDLDINITWIWAGPYDATYKYSTPYKFTPAIKIDWVTNNTAWVIHWDTETHFTITGSTNKTLWSSTMTGVHITHLLDTMSWTTDYTNDQISYQNLTWSIGQTTCYWSNTSTWYYHSHPTMCNMIAEPFSSNIIRAYPDITSITWISDLISASPIIVDSWFASFRTKYSSIISYYINWNNIIYPSFTISSSSINISQVKISGIVNQNNDNFSVIADSSINYIWNILKSDVYTLIHKNVAIYQKAGTWTTDTLYMTWNYTVPNPWPTWIETIIVDEWDVIIWTGITKTPWKVKTIIALKKSDWTKWNIWIKDNVQFVWATLIADRSVISWNWITPTATYYTDTNSAKNQLFIKWSVISYNTIGWSSKTPVSCPFYITNSSCNLQIAKRYDLNHFRSYIYLVPWYDPVPWLNTSIAWYANAPMIIEYDSDTQKNPPRIIRSNY